MRDRSSDNPLWRGSLICARPIWMVNAGCSLGLRTAAVLLLLEMCALALAPHIVWAQIDEELSRAFATEAPKAWIALKGDHSQVDAAGELVGVIVTGSADSGKHERTTRSFEFLENADCLRFVASKARGDVRLPVPEERRDWEKTAWGINRRYSFFLSYRGSSSQWVMESLLHDPSPEHAQNEALRRRLATDWGHYAWSPWQAWGLAFADVVRHPNFTLKGIQRVSANGKNYVVVEFGHNLSVDEDERRKAGAHLWILRGGKLTFWPDEHWALVESKLEIEEGVPFTERTIIEYGEKLGDARVLRSVSRASVFSGGSFEGKLTFTRYVFRDVPESEFTLSAFGLPDIDRPGESSWGRYLGAAIVVLLLLITVWLFVRLRRRKVAAAA